MQRSEPRSVKIELDGRSIGRVLVDGHDVSNSVRALEFRAEVGLPPRVCLEFIPEAIDVEAKAALVEAFREIDPVESPENDLEKKGGHPSPTGEHGS